MSKTLKLLTALFVAALLFTACGSDDELVDAGSGDTTVDDRNTDDDGTTSDDVADGSADDGTGDDADGPPLGAGPYPVGTLEVAITHPEADPVSYTISCLGDTATLTPVVEGLNEMAACEALNNPEAQTLLLEGPPADRVCTEIYGGPDEAAITGTLNDQPVDVVITRNNGCGIDDWDVVLAGVLPAALGATG